MLLKNVIVFLIVLFIFTTIDSYGQSILYDGPNDGAGDPTAERAGRMNANNIQLLFKNNSELGDWPRTDAHRWPLGKSSCQMSDGIGLMISARVFIKDSSTPVTDKNELELLAAKGLIDTLYYCQTNFREEMDTNREGTVEWGFHPVKSYMNFGSESPALSNDPYSWPQKGWPDNGNSLKWPGEWNGRFGRGIVRADLESFCVFNDAQDQEYLGSDDIVKYYPRPGIKIGDIAPNITTQRGLPWGGLGLRIEQRGYQWNQPMVKDVIFWEYKITNISDYDLPDVVVGNWIDNGLGGDGDGEGTAFNKTLNLSYSWDSDGIGIEGNPTGTVGFSVIESPGIAYDNIDNDEDGLIDEKRDNSAMIIVGSTAGIADLAKFLAYYHLEEKDLREHWDADEDQDWRDWDDANENGIYDSGEDCGDDIGLDGIAPGDINYFGPDADGTECNHKPDMSGAGYSEPNFGYADHSETDMLGITTMRIFSPTPHTPPFINWFRNDSSMWELMTSNIINESEPDAKNMHQVFGSGTFSLEKARTENYSFAILHSFDDPEGLRSSEHLAPTLFRTKTMTQFVYDNDYQFPGAPGTPELSAIFDEGFVTLTWNDAVEKQTREPFLENINDFEGYKLYRYTRYTLNDIDIEPIFVCDLKDGKQGIINYSGQDYFLGDDTGLQHSFIDKDIQIGVTYFYVLIAYDYGIDPSENIIGQDTGLNPGESTVNIVFDASDNLVSVSTNVAVITPNVSGQETPYVIDTSHIIGSGTVIPEAVLRNHLKKNHSYKIKFHNNVIDSIINYSLGGLYSSDGLSVYDVTDGQNTLVYQDIVESDDNGIEVPKNPATILKSGFTGSGVKFWHIDYPDEMLTGIFDGLRLKIQMPVILPEYDAENSGWIKGNSPMQIRLSVDHPEYFPWDYRIVFTDDDSAFIGRSVRTTGIYDENGVRIRGNILTEVPVNFYIQNLCFTDTTTGDNLLMDMIVHDLNENDQYDMLDDNVLVGAIDEKNKWAGTIFAMNFYALLSEQELPNAGDSYLITFKRPFYKTDSLIFRIDTENVQVGDKEHHVNDFALYQNYPNPFNADTIIQYSIAAQVHVNVCVYNILGQRINTFVDKMQEPGLYKINFNAGDLPSGIYIYKITAGAYNHTRKLILLK